MNFHNHLRLYTFVIQSKVPIIRLEKKIKNENCFIKFFQINEDSSNLIVIWENVSITETEIKIYNEELDLV